MTTVHLSHTRIANEGRAYLQRFVGCAAEYTTYEGNKLVGTLEFTPEKTGYCGPIGLIIRFADGRWAPADLTLKLAS